MSPLVSIIVPCYNGAKVMHRLFDSILGQTYRKIELILINDGSTDNSEEIWLSYTERFRNAGIICKYVYQKNTGLGGAINTGLQQVTGDYLCWPDIDDYFEPESIEKRMSFLEKHPDYGSVSSDAYAKDENDLITPRYRLASWVKYKFDTFQFYHMLRGQSLFCPGCHMVRVKHFRNVNPQMHIYPARRAQNMQMLLPIYYKYKRGFIDEPLYNYIKYNQSMSTPDKDLKNAIKRNKEYYKTIKVTLKTIKLQYHERVRCCFLLYEQRAYSNYYIYKKFSKPFLAYCCKINLLFISVLQKLCMKIN